MSDNWRMDFINEIGPLIKAEAKYRGYFLCSPIIAQATTESFKSSGLSLLASRYHNYFGMKCGKSWKGKSVNMKTAEEYTPGTLTNIQANFRAYSSMQEGVKGYFDFIAAPRYANLKTAITPEQYLEYIKADGYATSSTYVKTNLARIDMYGLRRFDWEIAITPYPVPTINLKKGSKGSGVMWLQSQLNRIGFGLKVDGIFGALTDAAVRAFQTERGLVPDGIVGKLTRAELIRI